MSTTDQFTLKGYVVWLVCAVFYLYEFFLRTVIGSFQKPVMHDLNLSSVEFSLLSTTIFLFIYGFMQIPVGLIVGQIGLKKSLLIGVILCAVASFGFSYAESYSAAICYRLLMGVGSSFGFICLLVSAQEWMPHRYSALFIGLSGFIGTLGAMLAAGPLESLSENSNIDWRFVFLCLGGAGFALSVLIWMFVDNNHQVSDKYVILSRPEKMWKRLMSLVSRSQPLYIALFSACTFFTIEYLSENEGRLFLLLKNCSHKFASYTITVSWLGYAIGGPVLGVLSDYFQRRKVFLIISALCGISSAIIVALSTRHSFIMGAFFLLGISASGQSIAFALIAEQFKKGNIALAFGLNNAMISTASALIAPLMGWMLDYSKAGCDASIYDYYFAFSVIVFLLVTSLLVSVFFIAETYCKSAVEFTYLKPPSKR